MDQYSGDGRCPVAYTIEVIGGKYKPLILWHLQNGSVRFGELRRRLAHATAKMLTQHLRELESDGLVRRTVFAVMPPRVEYSLTDRGKSVMPVLDTMCAWGRAQQSVGGCQTDPAEESMAPRRRSHG